MYYTQADLLSFGWTKTLIEKYLGKPDATKTNPFYRSAPPMKLYSTDRIKKIEKTEEFMADLSQTYIRRQSSAKAIDTKKRKTIEVVSQLSTPCEIKNVRQLAIDYYNENNPYDMPASIDSNPDFLKRIERNYIRHQRTNYDDLCKKIRGRVGSGEAYHKLYELTISKNLR